jgi:transposase
LACRERGGQAREGIPVREITNDEGKRLLQIVRRSSGSVVRWRKAQMVLLWAQEMDVAQIAKVALTSPDRVRAVLPSFNDAGFDSLAPKYSGGRPPTFTLPERRDIGKIALSRPVDHDLPFSPWSLTKLSEFLVAEGVVDDISQEGLRLILCEEGVSFQVIKTYKQSTDPHFEAKKNRVLELYEIADGMPKRRKGTRPSSSAWTSSGRCICYLDRASNGHRGSSKVGHLKNHGAGPPTPASWVSVACWPPTT